MPETIRAPGAYPDAPDASEVPAPPEPTLGELAEAKKAAEEALAEAQALGNPTLINRALAALDAAQRAYDEALAEAEGRRTRRPWPYGPPTRGSRELPANEPSDQPSDTQQQLPPEEKQEGSSAMWWALGILAAAGVAGGVWYYRRRQNPNAPTGEDLERNVLIAPARDEYFVSVRNREIGHYPDYDDAVRTAFKHARGLNVYVLEDDKVMLLSSNGEAVATWPWAGW